MRKQLRIIDTDLAHPHRTGALDEALLRARSKGLAPDTLHFYRRDPPGVSLGYFGKARGEVDLGYCAKNGIALVRRLSGGSAIYTDKGCLGYALVSKGLLPSSPNDAYERACGALVLGFEKLGVDAAFKPVNDVQVGGRKLSGSALLRRWGAQLVHGTILLEVDRERMSGALRVPREKLAEKGLETPGQRVTSLQEILGRVPALGKVKSAMAEGFEERFGLEAKRGELTEFERGLTDELLSQKYGTDEWNLKR